MKGGRGIRLGKIDEAHPQSRRGSYIRRIASLTPRCWCDGRFRLSIPTVSVRVSLPLRSRNRIPVEYTTLYSSIPRLSSTPPLLPTRFPRKPHQPPPRGIHLHLSSTFSCCISSFKKNNHSFILFFKPILKLD